MYNFQVDIIIGEALIIFSYFCSQKKYIFEVFEANKKFLIQKIVFWFSRIVLTTVVEELLSSRCFRDNRK
jgi:hypothetical protein